MARKVEMRAEKDEHSGRTAEDVPTLDAISREHLGRRMQELYEPIWDEELDPRLAELLQAMDRARSGSD